MSYKCDIFQKSGPSIDIGIFANQRQIKLFLKYFKKYQLNQILQHSRGMAHLLFEPLTQKICEIVIKLWRFKVENSPKSAPSTDRRFYCFPSTNWELLVRTQINYFNICIQWSVYGNMEIFKILKCIKQDFQALCFAHLWSLAYCYSLVLHTIYYYYYYFICLFILLLLFFILVLQVLEVLPLTKSQARICSIPPYSSLLNLFHHQYPLNTLNVSCQCRM